PLHIVKIGGNIVDDALTLLNFLKELSEFSGQIILVHGGGKKATQLAEQIGIKQQMIDGRRVTDRDTLDIVTMVYAGLINKNIVSKLCSLGKKALGLSGADGNLIVSHKRRHPSIDYGFVGDVDHVNSQLLHDLINLGLTPVFCAITHDTNGQLLNTNADTIAQEIAVSLSGFYDISLVYIFEKNGVLKDVNDEASLISILTKKDYTQFVAEGAIHSGMIPKLDNAFKAIDCGVDNVKIGKAQHLTEILHGKQGTKII
ncbi:MAG TPA: acetylglutamate kinase, partial [Saprospiraceae bacterium]|nr:acetylglutamate kinase [Saprospiraceae bacterium]